MNASSCKAEASPPGLNSKFSWRVFVAALTGIAWDGTSLPSESADKKEACHKQHSKVTITSHKRQPNITTMEEEQRGLDSRILGFAVV